MEISHIQIINGNEKRYAIINKETGEVIDDAQGYGYKTIQGAYKCYKYKNLSAEEKKERAKRINAVKKWCKTNRKLVDYLNDLEFQVYKGSFGEDTEFNKEFVAKVLEENGIKECDLQFYVSDLMKYGL